MFGDRWKTLTRGAERGPGGPVHPASRPAVQASPRDQGSRSGGPAQFQPRHSNGLEQFFGHIQREPALRLLDLSGASQANIGFITNLGHRLYSEDLLRSLDLAFGDGDFYENQADQERADAFLEQSLDFPENHFDGALVWDVLEFLTPSLLKAAVDRLHYIIKPGSYLLAIFHSEERAGAVPTCFYRISSADALLLAPRGLRRPAQFFNNRAIERVFQAFESVKFFLTRDSLREVIVKR